jgi:Arc/MetJ-type ribon-helix-helix transcriptional regulator
MGIQIKSEHRDWLEAQVAAGHFDSVEDAVAVAIADLKAAGDDDLSWARPLIDEARRSVEAGDFVEGDEFIAEINAQIASLPEL